MPKYLVNVMETYLVEAESEDDVYETNRVDWLLEESDVMIVGEA